MSAWFSVADEGKLACCICGNVFAFPLYPDHHPSWCPSCNTECLLYPFKGQKALQLVPAMAPDPVQAFILWAQQHLDEIDFLELVCAFEEIALALHNAPAQHKDN